MTLINIKTQHTDSMFILINDKLYVLTTTILLHSGEKLFTCKLAHNSITIGMWVETHENDVAADKQLKFNKARTGNTN